MCLMLPLQNQEQGPCGIPYEGSVIHRQVRERACRHMLGHHHSMFDIKCCAVV